MTKLASPRPSARLPLLAPRLLGAALVAAVPLAACAEGREATFDPPADAGVEGGADETPRADAGGAEGGGFTPADAGTPVSGECFRELSTGRLVLSDARCFTNQYIENTKAKVYFPCTGGDAEVSFGPQKFVGTVRGDVLDAENEEDFVYDGCRWRSTQRIKGDLSKGTLQYTYNEVALQTCAGQFPCTASGNLQASAGAVQPSPR